MKLTSTIEEEGDRRQNLDGGEGLAGDVVVHDDDEDALVASVSTNDSIFEQESYNDNHLQLVKIPCYNCKTVN